jgi:LysR family transcriptional regulator, nod-box dependent transcriptional activator
MRFNKLDLNLLVALDAMITERSISKAAQRMHMSQSAMSNALSRLREYFDDDLLVQVGRKMELTPRAESLMEAVRDVLVRIDTTVATQLSFDPASADREFKIFVSDFTLATLAPHLLALASRVAPRVRFQFLAQIDQPQKALERGEADLLVIPKSYCSPDHPVDPLFEEDFCCITWSGSRIAQSELTFEVYANAGHVVMQPLGGAPSFEAWFVQRFGLTRRIEVTSFSFASTPDLVVNTERIATVHSRLGLLACKSRPLKIQPVPIAFPKMEQVVQWHRYRTQDSGLIWLRDLLHTAVGEMDRTLGIDPEPPREG